MKYLLIVVVALGLIFAWNEARAQVVPAQNQILLPGYFGDGYLISSSTSPTAKLGAQFVNLIGGFVTGTTTASCAGTVSCSPFIIIGAAPATITGVGDGTGNVATSSTETNTYIPFWTSTGATPALLSGGTSDFTWDGTKLFANYASSTALTVSENTWLNSTTTIGTVTNPIVVAGTIYRFIGNIGTDDTAQNAGWWVERNAAACPFGCGYAMARSRGDNASKTIVQDGDDLGSIWGLGYDGTDYAASSRIQLEVDGTPGAGDMPGRINFLTSADGFETPLERMRITSAGYVGIGTTTPAAKLDVYSTSVAGIAVTGNNPAYATVDLKNTAGTTSFGLRAGITSVSNSGFSIYDTVAAASRFVVTDAGNVGIATTTPGAALAVTGEIYSSSFVNTATSGGYKIGGRLVGYASSTNLATIWGLNAGGKSATTSSTAYRTTAVGNDALRSLTSGFFATAVGDGALRQLTTGSNNTAVGRLALTSITTTSGNTGIGEEAGFGVIGSNNTVVGYSALAGSSVNSSDNVAVGASALSSLTQSSTANIAIGRFAGSAVTSGYGNIIIGKPGQSTNGVTTGGENILIGFNAMPPINGATNSQLNIGNIIFGNNLPATTTSATVRLPVTGNIGIGSTTPYAKFSVHSNGGDTATTLFAIASSTASATTTHFSVTNTGAIFALNITPSTAGTNQDVCFVAATGEIITDTTGTCIVSSRRFKHDIRTLDLSGSDVVMRLRSVSFSPNDDDSADFKDVKLGFIAEEVAEADPHLAKYGLDGEPRTLDDHAILSVVVKALQEVIQADDARDQKIAELEARLTALEGGQKLTMCILK